MALAQRRETEQVHDSFPTLQLFILATCRVAEPIALTSIFPYAYPMVKSFHVGSEHDAALYAGILISSFSFSEALTGMFWGALSDRIGRKPVLLIGCCGTMLSMLMMGFASSFWFALLARSLGGLLNGNIAVIQTMVGELVKNPEHEPKAFAVMPFVWSIGTIIGPCISGLTVGSPLFPSLPYLLPNLICAGLLALSIAVGYLFLDETREAYVECREKDEEWPQPMGSPLVATAGATYNSAGDLRVDSYGTFTQVEIRKRNEAWNVRIEGFQAMNTPQKVFNRRVVLLVVSLGILCYHCMSYDHLLPIFLQDERPPYTKATLQSRLAGGLGMTTTDVGLIMSADGLIALMVQGIVFPLLTGYLGVWRLFQLVTILHPLAYLLVPFVALLSPDRFRLGIYACLTVRNLFTIVAYPLNLILIKEAAAKRSLGKINGLAASVGAGARMVGPPMGGILYGMSMPAAWWGTGIMALVGSVQVCWMSPGRGCRLQVRPPYAAPPADEDEHGNTVAHYGERS